MAAALAVTATALQIRLRGVKTSCGAALEAARGKVAASEQAWLRRQWRAVAATRRLPWSTCLTRSLTLWRRARRHGLTGRLCLGVARRNPFEAHAWVEFDGLVLGVQDGPPRSEDEGFVTARR
ncbi:MAG: lasso peptide biosynthesis B2 protein [Xanthomonadales bacterium]|nr:lasso peptide biosynthesis B2 protein [Xanthomonadales bacterium]